MNYSKQTHTHSKIMKIIHALIITTFSLTSFAQKQTLSKEMKERYYSSQINVGSLDRSLYDSLKLVNTEHPSRFYEICGSFIQDSMLNEAAVAYFIGRNRYRLYNKTNPDYEASGDGALAGSFAYMYGEVFNQYLNQNIDNYSALLQKSGEWYRDNKHLYFKASNSDSIYQVQTTALFNLANELKTDPSAYINQLEKARKELDEMLSEINDTTELETFEEEIIEEGIETEHRPTSEIPEAFFSNYNGDYFIVNKENEISAVAHGYYDTSIESSDAEIVQNKNNSLHYTIKPFKEGNCVIKLFGVTQDGSKIQLAVYNIKVLKK